MGHHWLGIIPLRLFRLIYTGHGAHRQAAVVVVVVGGGGAGGGGGGGGGGGVVVVVSWSGTCYVGYETIIGLTYPGYFDSDSDCCVRTLAQCLIKASDARWNVKGSTGAAVTKQDWDHGEVTTKPMNMVLLLIMMLTTMTAMMYEASILEMPVMMVAATMICTVVKRMMTVVAMTMTMAGSCSL